MMLDKKTRSARANRVGAYGRSNLAALAVFVESPHRADFLRARKLIVKSARGG